MEAALLYLSMIVAQILKANMSCVYWLPFHPWEDSAPMVIQTIV